MKYLYEKLVIAFIFVLVEGCKGDEPTSPSINPFAGRWTIFLDELIQKATLLI